MQNAEDEVDATAAAEAEKEAADELAEFTVEPPLTLQGSINHADHDAEVDPDNHQELKAGTDGSSSSEKDGKEDESGSVTSLRHDEDDNYNDGDGQDDQTGNKPQPSELKGPSKTSPRDTIEDDEGFGGLNKGMIGSEEMNLLLEKFLPIEKFAIQSIELVSSLNLLIEAYMRFSFLAWVIMYMYMWVCRCTEQLILKLQLCKLWRMWKRKIGSWTKLKRKRNWLIKKLTWRMKFGWMHGIELQPQWNTRQRLRLLRELPRKRESNLYVLLN